jgi:hypothetical protein
MMNIIPIKNWGKDHWSTFAYAETLAVDHKGIVVPEPTRMRTNHKTHPFMRSPIDESKYPTILKNGEAVRDHDDWNCLDDAVENGLLDDIGTGLIRTFSLTKRGREVADLLREHKSSGGTFKNFDVEIDQKFMFENK